MKIILTSVGTRGDMEPFLAIGELLKKKGHEVICVFPEQFRGLAHDAGLSFRGLNPDFIKLIESREGKMVMGGKGTKWQKLKALMVLYKKSLVINKVFVDELYEIIKNEKPDRVLYNGKATYPIIWGMDNPGKAILISPVPGLIQAVKEIPHVGININLGPFVNILTYKLATFGLIQNVASTTKKYRKKLGITASKIRKAVQENRKIYTVSPSLFARPSYWPEGAKVLGFSERNKTLNWKADQGLLDFLDKNHEPIMVTFGSMVNSEPAQKTKIILEVLKRNNIPAIINTSSGGLIEPREYDKDLFYFVSNIPYDWAFPKMKAVVHHGGSGTTHTAVKYACPSLIIPHIVDQFLWNTIISEKGLGPRGVAMSKITEKNFELLVLDLVNNSEYKKKSEEISLKMKEENFEEELYEEIVKVIS